MLSLVVMDRSIQEVISLTHFLQSFYSRGRSYRVRTVISFRKPCNGTPIFDREPRSNRDLLKE